MDESASKDIQNLFRLKKENEAIQNRIIRDIRKLFEHEKNLLQNSKAVNFWSNIYMKYESKGDRSKTISVVEYLNKTRPYLKDIISKLKKTGT